MLETDEPCGGKALPPWRAALGGAAAFSQRLHQAGSDAVSKEESHASKV